jgi:hypothetical protein
MSSFALLRARLHPLLAMTFGEYDWNYWEGEMKISAGSIFRTPGINNYLP